MLLKEKKKKKKREKRIHVQVWIQTLVCFNWIQPGVPCGLKSPERTMWLTWPYQRYMLLITLKFLNLFHWWYLQAYRYCILQLPRLQNPRKSRLHWRGSITVGLVRLKPLLWCVGFVFYYPALPNLACLYAVLIVCAPVLFRSVSSGSDSDSDDSEKNNTESELLKLNKPKWQWWGCRFW